MEVECCCPFIEVRSRLLACKFLIKSLLVPNLPIINEFLELNNSWRYIGKSLPILASMCHSINHLVPLAWHSNKRLFIYDVPFNMLVSFPYVKIDPSFLGITYSSLLNLLPYMVNDLFRSYIAEEFFDCCLAFIDGSVLTASAGYAVFISNFHISFFDVFHRFSSSFSVEGHAIVQALLIIQTLPPDKYIIISDSQVALFSNYSCFQSIQFPFFCIFCTYLFFNHQSKQSRSKPVFHSVFMGSKPRRDCW